MEHTPIILLTTDGSPDSLRALGPTVALARRMRGRILFLSVVADPTPPGVPTDPFAPPPWLTDRDAEAQVIATRQRLEGIVAQVGPGPDIEPVVLRGENVAAVISSLAAVRGVDFIAMASHGRRGLQRVLLGSVTESVVRRSSVPVIVFPVAA